jgi:hypothetical protein
MTALTTRSLHFAASWHAKKRAENVVLEEAAHRSLPAPLLLESKLKSFRERLAKPLP